jgi:hypothetical protein
VSTRNYCHGIWIEKTDRETSFVTGWLICASRLASLAIATEAPREIVKDTLTKECLAALVIAQVYLREPVGQQFDNFDFLHDYLPIG